MIGWLYDFVNRGAERKLAERRRQLVAPLEGDVVEVGAGTGANLPFYERASRVVAVEPDASMAKRLRRRAAHARVPVEIVTASAESLPFPDETFDGAVATFVLCSVQDVERSLAEVRRVLRPRGTLVLFEHVRGEGRVARWQDRLTPAWRKIAGKCHLNRDALGAVERAGFDVAGVERTAIPDALPFIRAAVQGRATKISS